MTAATCSRCSFADLDKAHWRGTQMQNTDPRLQAQPKTSKPVVLTADDAIERLDTWLESPPEELADAVLSASVAWVDDPTIERRDALIAAVSAWTAERVERVQTSSGSFGCAQDADGVREELRASKMIVEVEGQTMGGVMLLARGCRVAYLDSEGCWRGVGTKKRGAGS